MTPGEIEAFAAGNAHTRKAVSRWVKLRSDYLEAIIPVRDDAGWAVVRELQALQLFLEELKAAAERGEATFKAEQEKKERPCNSRPDGGRIEA